MKNRKGGIRYDTTTQTILLSSEEELRPPSLPALSIPSLLDPNKQPDLMPFLGASSVL